MSKTESKAAQIWDKIRLKTISVFALPERTLDPHYLKATLTEGDKLIVKILVAPSRPILVDLLQKEYVVTETMGTEDLIIEQKPTVNG